MSASDDETDTTIAEDPDGEADGFANTVMLENTLWTDPADTKTDMLV